MDGWMDRARAKTKYILVTGFMLLSQFILVHKSPLLLSSNCAGFNSELTS